MKKIINLFCPVVPRKNWDSSVATISFGTSVLLKYTMLFSVIIFSILASAQDCTKELLSQKPGTWKGGLTDSKGGMTAADLAREKKIVLAIHTMIKSKYSPMSIAVRFHGGYSYPHPVMPINGYSYRITSFNFYCDGNAIKTAGHTNTSFQITANNDEAGIYDTVLEGGRYEGFFSISDMPVEKDGYWYFKEIDVGLGFGMTGKSSRWLITYDGKLPYAYVTKKEFLERMKPTLYNRMQEIAAHFKNTLTNNEIAKGFKEKEYKNNPAKLEKYMEMEYLQIKERYEKQLADNERSFKPAFDKIENQLKMPASELNQQAIVKMDPYDHLSYLFTDDDDGFGKILIKPNPEYFNKKIPKSSPQFFSIDVRGNHKDPASAKFMTDIMKAVDFATLKNMLGK